MNVYNLILEVTRRCNFKCEHCLRGNAQNVDMTEDIIRTFLDKNNVGYITTLTFTGGEPLLNIDFMLKVLDIIKEKGISLGCWWMATNGGIADDNTLSKLLDLKIKCMGSDLESVVEISKSVWHEKFQEKEKIKKLKLLRFVENKWETKNVIKQGRAINLNCANNNRYFNKRYKLYDYYPNVVDEVYINAKGDFIPDCDLSYKTQNYHKLGNVKDTLLYDLVKDLIINIHNNKNVGKEYAFDN